MAGWKHIVDGETARGDEKVGATQTLMSARGDSWHPIDAHRVKGPSFMETRGGEGGKVCPGRVSPRRRGQGRGRERATRWA